MDRSWIMQKRVLLLVGGVLLAGLVPAKGDTESENWIFVEAATTDGTTSRGGYYAKCIPAELSGTNGVTKIYRVGRNEDTLEFTYDWYSARVSISGASEKVSVVRFGSWNNGDRANSNDLALAFYYDGRLLKSYSTLDIAGQPDNVTRSVSHYEWCQEVGGYGWIVSASSRWMTYGFTLKTIDGRTLCFDVKTGTLVRDGKPENKG